MTTVEQTSAQTNTQADATPQAETTTPVTQESAHSQEPAKSEVVATAEVQAKEEVKEVVYDLKLPDGSLLDAGKVAEVTAYAKEHGLTNEQAQGILTRESDAVKTWQSNQAKAFEETTAKWVDAVMDDKEIGGPDFNKNVEYAHRALEKFASVELKEALKTTGFGNHPELVRVFSRIGKAMADDTFVRGGSGNAQQKKSMEDVFYGNKN